MHVRIACLLTYCGIALTCYASAPRPSAPEPGHPGLSAPERNDSPRTPEPGTRERLIYEAEAYLGTREATGNNDGPIVELIIVNSGFPAKSRIPYCGAFNRMVYDQASLPEKGPQGTASAWSPNWVLKPSWTLLKGGETPKPGDSGGIYFPGLKRVGHTFLIKSWGSASCFTIEGNTNDALSREGDGIYAKRRPVKSLYAARNWFVNP
jgi:hypothetical protein